MNEVDVKALFKALFYIWRRYLFRFIIIKFIVKKCYFVSKEVLFDWRKLFLMSPFMRLFCCFSFFLAHGCFCSCRREGYAMSYLIWGCFFYSFDDFFFNDLMKYNHGFFPPLFCVRFSVSCFFKKRKVFSCWFVKKVFVEWIGLFVEWVVGEFVFFLIPIFFWMGLKKFFSMKEVFFICVLFSFIVITDEKNK